MVKFVRLKVRLDVRMLQIVTDLGHLQSCSYAHLEQFVETLGDDKQRLDILVPSG